MGHRHLTLRELERRIDAYFTGEESFRSPAGLALALGTDSGTLREMREGEGPAAGALKLAMTRLEKELVENGLRGKCNATMTSFLLKTQFGYREKSAQAKEADDPVELPEELKKYAV